MTTIKLATNDQKLLVVEKTLITTGDVNSVELHVEFDGLWNDFVGKEAVFFTSKKPTPIPKVLADGKCKVPFECLCDVCTLHIGIRGVAGEKVKTTTLVKLKIEEGTPTPTGIAEEPTADVYQQILTNYGVLDKSVSDLKNNVDEQKTADTKNNTITFESADTTEPEVFEEVEVLQSGEKHSSLLKKISMMFKNVRRLISLMGTTDISEIGNGTVTDVLNELNNNMNDLVIVVGVNYDVNLTIQGNKSATCNLPISTRDSAIPVGYKLVSATPIEYMTGGGYTGVYRAYRSGNDSVIFIQNYASTEITINTVSAYYLAIREIV